MGEAAKRTIYIRAVVDVGGVVQDKSQADSETQVRVSANSERLIVTAMPGNADRTAGKIAVEAAPGDILRLYAVSGSNNFDDVVLIQNISQEGADKVDEVIVTGAALVNLQQAALVPATEAGEMTATDASEDFWFWQCTIAGEGTQNFSSHLALYSRDEEGQPRFAVTYRWDLALTVSLTAPPDTKTSTEE